LEHNEEKYWVFGENSRDLIWYLRIFIFRAHIIRFSWKLADAERSRGENQKKSNFSDISQQSQARMTPTPVNRGFFAPGSGQRQISGRNKSLQFLPFFFTVRDAGITILTKGIETCSYLSH